MAAALQKASILFMLVTVAVCQVTDVTINTAVGTFIGFQKDVNVDRTTVSLNKFLGIPYAEPPVGELRFEKPVPKAALSAPLITQKHGSECVQIQGNTSGPASEDCLFLNVYAPDTTDNGGPLAVMLWIHGGGYVFGSADTYVSDLLAARGNVIVVTINYRLSVLGFLNTGRGRPSNFGLWDQHLAIQWVHDNIEAFGGDKDRVTIFGESAGAGSVMLQGAYPGNRGLFKRIIAQSGTGGSPWSETLDPWGEAAEFIDIVGCNRLLSTSTLSCLRALPADTIYQTLNNFTNGLYRDPIPFVPSVDRDFIKVNTKDIFNSKKNVAANERNVLSTFDLLIGANAAEGGIYLNAMNGVQGNPEDFLPNRTFFEETLIPFFMNQQSIEGDRQAVKELLASTYTTWEDPENPVNIRRNFVDMHGDFKFLVPSIITTELFAQLSRTGPYMYQFNANPSLHLFGAPTWVDRPAHADDLLYVFGEVNEFNEWATTGPFQDWEKVLSRNIMILWSNFAKTGNPNQPQDLGVNWEPYTSSSKKYLDIGRFLNETVTKENLILNRVNMWDQVMPAVNEAVSRAGLVCDVTDSAPAVMYSASWTVCMFVSVILIALSQ